MKFTTIQNTQIDFSDLEEIDGGQISRSYTLDIDSRPCILQFTEHNMTHGYLNERFFSQIFGQIGIPIRNVLHEGDFADLHFTIAEKVPGKGLHQLPSNELIAVLSDVMDIVLKFASVDTSHP